MGPDVKWKITSGLLGTASDYKEARKRLQEQYGREEVVLQRIMTKLQRIRPVQDDNDVEGLRQVLNQVDVNTNALRSLGISESEFAVTVYSILYSIVPTNLLVDVGKIRKISKAVDKKFQKMMQDRDDEVELNFDNVSITSSVADTVIDNCNELIEYLREYILENESHANVTANRNSTKNRGPENKFSASQLLVGNNSRGKFKNNGTQCLFCDEAHAADKCTKNLTAAQRQEN